ncbi:MAG: hypothetical protein M3340_12735 [Actinomycetota bacterium]|nr:hypothetical protein [Actinomycetota bacterium]
MRPEFVFSDDERDALHEAFLSAFVSPYDDYQAFRRWIRELALVGDVVTRYAEFCDELAGRDFAQSPLYLVANCPIDRDLPVFDPADPVRSKYERKRTFATESFLALHAALTCTELVAHASVNGGDFFHDIYPKESMYESQSQKTLGTLRFHRDFTNHFVRPDFVSTIVLRDTPENEVFSTYVVNRDLIRSLPAAVVEVLRQERFHTPYDDISTQGGSRLGRAPDHAVVTGDAGVRLFEGRTRGTDPEAELALDACVAALHRLKVRYTPGPGDLVAFSNDHLLHGREVVAVRDIESMRRRWLMKTHNVYALEPLERFFLSDRYGVVDG